MPEIQIRTTSESDLAWVEQLFGFRLCALRTGVIAEYRKIKPEIPMTGEDNIPIRDEIQLEMEL